MSDEKFKFTPSTPVDDRGFVVKLTITEDTQSLRVKHYPEFLWYGFGFVGILVVFLIALLTNPELLAVAVLLLVVLVFFVFNARAFVCTIDKKTGLIHYHLSGVLMTSVDEQKSEYPVSEAVCLEIHRYVKGGRWSWGDDTFQVVLLLKGDRRISLTPSNLGFREAQEFLERVRIFFGNEIPVKAFD